MLSSPPHPTPSQIQWRSIDRVSKFNECYHPHPTTPSQIQWRSTDLSKFSECYLSSMNVINLCSLLIYTPSSVRHWPRRNRCVFSCKMCLAFILTVNLYATPANPGDIVVFSHVKCAWAHCLHFDCKIYVKFTCPSRRPWKNRCVFSCNMLPGFISTVNLREMYVPLPPTAEKSLCFLT